MSRCVGVNNPYRRENYGTSRVLTASLEDNMSRKTHRRVDTDLWNVMLWDFGLNPFRSGTSVLPTQYTIKSSALVAMTLPPLFPPQHQTV